MRKMIENIDYPSDLKRYALADLKVLAKEIRSLLITKSSLCGGHLASNLGVVELTIALHYVFNAPIDKIIFDVSHQCYTHKILTGRKKAFVDDKMYYSISGFTNPDESEYDLFNIGHTSTSISLACGYAKSRDLLNQNYNVIAVIGDSALDGGESFEALNCCSEIDGGLIVVINDNQMSIPENHGYLSKHLNELYLSNGELKNNYFKCLGFEYYLVDDAHDIFKLVSIFSKIKDLNKKIVIHCRTKKGKGYLYAENNPEKWHHAHPFDIKTGIFNKSSIVPKENYGSIIGDYLISKIKINKKIIAMTASVPACFGFKKEYRGIAGSNFLDVGISEQNMICMAAAMAKNGCKPILVTESSFYQRAYDQIEQELNLNSCPAVLLIAFSGIYGHNDNTHIGIYDISLFSNLKNIIYLSPSNMEDYIACVDWAVEQFLKPVMIRIPWNGVKHISCARMHDFFVTEYSIIKKGRDVAIFGVGSFFQLGEQVYDSLKVNFNLEATLIDPIILSSIDEKTLNNLKNNHSIIVVIEDGVKIGGFGSKIAQFYSDSNIKVLTFGFNDEFPSFFDREQIMIKNQLTVSTIVSTILKKMNDN